jgi:cellobiose-specific phosphotransferase system component IIB
MKNHTPSLKSLRVALVCAAATATIFSLASCKVRQTQEAKAPEVEVKDGQMPKYEVDTAKVDVTMEKKEVTVPKITTEQREVNVPNVDVTMPGEQAASPTPTP